MELYTLYSKIYYENSEYKKIIILDKKPKTNGLINNIVKYINISKLSIFDIDDSCAYAILNPNNLNKFLKLDEITILFSWLINNGYNINTSITKLITKSNLEIKNNIICLISSNNLN